MLPPALRACFGIASKYKTLIVDANTEAGSTYDVVAQGVDCIRYRPRVSLLPDGRLNVVGCVGTGW